jgi:hypothetical protein
MNGDPPIDHGIARPRAPIAESVISATSAAAREPMAERPMDCFFQRTCDWNGFFGWTRHCDMATATSRSESRRCSCWRRWLPPVSQTPQGRRQIQVPVMSWSMRSSNAARRPEPVARTKTTASFTRGAPADRVEQSKRQPRIPATISRRIARGPIVRAFNPPATSADAPAPKRLPARSFSIAWVSSARAPSVFTAPVARLHKTCGRGGAR